jgi:hypothetical protein
MKKQIRIGLFSLILALSTLNPTFAQYDDIANFLKGGTGDAEKLFEAYLTPYANAFGNNTAAGWYNTAKPHETLGFDITLTLNTSFIPAGKREFDFNSLNLSSLTLSNGSDRMLPTAASDKTGQRVETILKKPNGSPVISFNTPDGTKYPIIPMPMVQVGLGLFFGTELTARYLPTITIEGGKINLWGIGVKHSISQWIPIIKKLDLLNISLQGGYTKLTSTADISFGPDQFTNIRFEPDKSVFQNQSIDYSMSSLTGNLIISANIPIICFYGGVGFIKTKTNLKFLGTYPIKVSYNPTINETYVANSDIGKDPIDMTFGTELSGKITPKVNAGLRLKLGFLTIHGDYSFAQYSLVTVGLGISFR